MTIPVLWTKRRQNHATSPNGETESQNGRIWDQPKYLAKKIGRTEPYVSDRMLGRRPFTVDDVYVLCKLLSIPVGEVLEYFPPSIRKGGRSGGQ